MKWVVGVETDCLCEKGNMGEISCLDEIIVGIRWVVGLKWVVWGKIGCLGEIFFLMIRVMMKILNITGY